MTREAFHTQLTCDLAGLNNLLVHACGAGPVYPALLPRLHEAIKRLFINANHLHSEFRIFFPGELTIELTMAAASMLRAFSRDPVCKVELGHALVHVRGAYAMCGDPALSS